MLDFDAQLFAGQISKDLSTLRSTPAAVAALLKERRAALIDLERDDRLSASYKAELRVQMLNDYKDRLDSLRYQATEARRALEAKGRDALTPMRTPEESLAYETRALRMWERYKGLLDAKAIDPLTLLERESGNLEALRVLREELPDYMAAHNQAPEFTQAVTAILDQRERPLLSDKERLARDVQAEVADGWTRLATGLDYAQDELETNSPWTVLPAWEGKGATVSAE